MFGIVYLITCSFNGKHYVGITQKSIEKRFREHVYAALKRGPECAIHHAIAKHGPSWFSIKLLQSCDSRDELLEAEVHWIAQLKTHISTRLGYNQTFGGDGWFGCKHTEATKQRISEANSGERHWSWATPVSELTRVRLRNSSMCKQILQIDLDGNIIEKHQSARAAARKLGMKDHTTIIKCCRGTYHCKTSGGFRWEYGS